MFESSDHALGLFLRGALVGFSIAAPVGPIGVLCIRRSIAHGRITGLITGLGAACADTLYGLIAALGVGAVSSFLLAYQFWLEFFGGGLLAYLGARSALSRPSTQVPKERGSHHSAFLSTFILTLTNPLTLLAFLAIFASLGVAVSTDQRWAVWTVVLGVFCGSLLWWLILSSLASLFHGKLQQVGLVWVNRVSGAMLVAFGLVAMLKALEIL